MALLLPVLVGAARAADLQGQLGAGGVRHEVRAVLVLALVDVFGAAGGLVHGLALLGSISIANLSHAGMIPTKKSICIIKLLDIFYRRLR